MITSNFEDFPDHRVKFFKLLRSINSHCFPGLFGEEEPKNRRPIYSPFPSPLPTAFLGMQEKSFSLIIDSIVWAFKHTMKDVAESGLLIMLELWKYVFFFFFFFFSFFFLFFPPFSLFFVRNVSNCNNAEFAGMFVRRFYVSILTDVLVVLTDRLHKSGSFFFFLFIFPSFFHQQQQQKGFKLQSQILQAMITVVESGHVQVPLFDPSSQPSGMTNQLFLRNFLKNLLEEGFPILNGFFSSSSLIPFFFLSLTPPPVSKLRNLSLDYVI